MDSLYNIAMELLNRYEAEAEKAIMRGNPMDAREDRTELRKQIKRYRARLDAAIEIDNDFGLTD